MARRGTIARRAGSSDVVGPAHGPTDDRHTGGGGDFAPVCLELQRGRTRMATDIEKAPEALQELVAKVDTGARKPLGVTAKVIFTVAFAWALFQFWYASPLPFTFGVGILNDTEARSLHLAFALFLAFTAWPAFGSSPRDRVPVVDWAFALGGAF